MKIYQIDSSARKKGSTSRALAKKLLEKIKKPGDEFIYRGPMGVFTLPDNLMERDIYMVSTG